MSSFLPQVTKKIVFLNSQQIRWLPRWSHRRPVNIIPSEAYDREKDTSLHSEEPFMGTEDDAKVGESGFEKKNIKWKQPDPFKISKFAKDPNQDKINWQRPAPKPLTLLSKSQEKKKEHPSFDMLETIIDQDGNFVYTKMKDNDLRISKIMMEIKSKKEKHKNDLMLLEGRRLIIEALQAGCKLEYILFSRTKEINQLKPFLPKIGAQLYKMPYREMQVWSDLTTNPGIMGVFKIPDLEQIKPSNHIPLTVICDNIREPNNLGSILRTCCGVGCERVILTKGCVNVWDSKVLRSSSGAHFYLQISKKLDWDEIRKNIPETSTVFIADNLMISSENQSTDLLSHLVQNVPVLPYSGVEFGCADYLVLIIGGETEGISEQSYKLANDLKGVRLNVPLSNNLDSINTGVALGVIAFEIKRQLLLGQATRK